MININIENPESLLEKINKLCDTHFTRIDEMYVNLALDIAIDRIHSLSGNLDSAEQFMKNVEEERRNKA